MTSGVRVGDGPFDRAGDLFAHHRAHAAAHELPLHGADIHAPAVQRSRGRKQRIGELRGFLGRGQLGAIGFVQAERVGGRHSGVEFFKVAVEQHAQARAGVDPKVKLALGAALEVLVQGFFPDDLAAAFALQPQAFGAEAFFAFGRAFVHAGFFTGKPRHRVQLLA